jgi:hypothetical protein
MPARKGRRDLTAADARAEARMEGLREAAQRASAVLERTAAEPLAPEAEADAPPARTRRGFRWPFGRKPDPQAQRQAEIFSQLEAAVAGRPRAADRARAAEAQSPPERSTLRAAG